MHEFDQNFLDKSFIAFVFHGFCMMMMIEKNSGVATRFKHIELAYMN